MAGDPTVATAEKGRLIFERAVENFVQFVREFRAREDVSTRPVRMTRLQPGPTLSEAER